MKYLPSFLLLILVSCSNVNNRLPDFAVATLSGDTVRSSDLKGKTVVINIWATWCGPCVAEIDELNTLAARYAGDTSVVFLAITDDPAEKIRNFTARRPFSYIQVADAKELKNTFQRGLIKTIPEHIIVNKEGLMVYDETGLQPDLEQVLGKILAEGQP